MHAGADCYSECGMHGGRIIGVASAMLTMALRLKQGEGRCTMSDCIIKLASHHC